VLQMISRWTLLAAAGAATMIAGCQQTQNNAAPKTAPGQLPSLSNLKDQTAPPAADTPKINATTYYAHAHLLEKQGNFGQAAAQYEQVLTLQPDFLAARNRLGVTLNKLGHHAEATKNFQMCVAAQPNVAFLHNNLGFSLFLEGKYDQADGSFRRALELKPDFVRARMNLAVNDARRNQFDASYQEFAKACSQADALYNVGILLVEAGRYADAAQYLEGALAANPQFDAARKQLNEVARLAAQGDVASPPTATRTQMLTAIEPSSANPAQVSLAGDPTESGAITFGPTIPVTQTPPTAAAAPTPAPAPIPTPIATPAAETGAVTFPATIPVTQEPAKTDTEAVTIYQPTIPVIQVPEKSAATTPPTATPTKSGG
jgi:tetratricopeptide (TPR) repeat protein